jgi:hypothetical protein
MRLRQRLALTGDSTSHACEATVELVPGSREMRLDALLNPLRSLSRTTFVA